MLEVVRFPCLLVYRLARSQLPALASLPFQLHLLVVPSSLAPLWACQWQQEARAHLFQSDRLQHSMSSPTRASPALLSLR